MKLLDFYTEANAVHLGIVEGDQVFDLSAAMPKELSFASVAALLRGEGRARQQAQDCLAHFRSSKAFWHPLEMLKHAPLLDRTCRIFGVGMNYADHVAENNLPNPDSPIFFAKLVSVVTPHNEPIFLPACSEQVDYEAELAFVIGHTARRVSQTEAGHCIAGYTIMNDVTARDLQIHDQQWFRGKNCDGFAPLGPWLVTADEISDACNLEIALKLNGHVMQDSNTRNLIFKPATLVAFLSQTLTLEPGDVISTGTPSGIGYYRTPQQFLHAGDSVEIQVKGIGVLRNKVERRQEPG
jgi:2-keto-4-pentenoate hydratase/2-oxohepta-3-ene-1,7-dioic acid hydratase in catechol pathway